MQILRMLDSFREMSLTDRRYNSAAGSSSSRETARWLSVEQIRKQQRMRRETVVAAMLRGDLPFEQRGRIRYARVSDIEAWERSRISRASEPTPVLIHPDLAELSHAQVRRAVSGATCRRPFVFEAAHVPCIPQERSPAISPAKERLLRRSDSQVCFARLKSSPHPFDHRPVFR